MNMKAVLNKNIGSLRKGTEFTHRGGVFVSEHAVFTMDLVLGSKHFRVVDEKVSAITSPSKDRKG